MSTGRVQLVALPPAHLRALLVDEGTFESVSGIKVAPGIRDFFFMAPEAYRARIATATEPDPWNLGFAVVETATNTWIACAGYKGPPDAAGAVEIAYGVAPSQEGQGFATEIAAALVAFAFRDSTVSLARAHTLPERNASGRVLEKTGFQFMGPVTDPEDGLVWRWEKARG